MKGRETGPSPAQSGPGNPSADVTARTPTTCPHDRRNLDVAPRRPARGVARPFKGSAQGYITAQIPPNGLFLEMSGQATDLGQFTREEYAYLGPDGSVVGTITFTAANGDELWVEIDGAFTSATDVEGLYIIIGGTGRFQNATGQAAFHAFTPDFVYAEVTFEGTVSY